MPITAMYFRILKRFSDDITTKKRDIKKNSDQLIQTYLKYIGIVRDQQQQPKLFKNLEIILATEIFRRGQPKPPLKPPPTLTVTDLRNIIDQEYAEFIRKKEEKFFTGKRQSELTSLLETIEKYRLAVNHLTAYDDLFNAIQGNFRRTEKLVETLKQLTIHFLNTKNVDELKNYIQEINDYRDLTSDLQTFQNIYNYALQRIVILQQPKKPPKPPEMGIWLTQNNTEGLFFGQDEKYYNILQVNVYPQRTGASCGYHSLKNSILIVRAILKKGAIKLVNNKYFIAQHIGQPADPGVWRDMIIDRQRKSKQLYVTGEWLNEGDIMKLEAFERKQGLLKDLGIEYTVIENVQMMQPSKLREFAAYRTVSEIAEKIKGNNNYQHAFSLGLMGHYVDGQAHWISLVVNKVNGVVQFIVADSLNINRYDLTQEKNNVVRILIEELSK